MPKLKIYVHYEEESVDKSKHMVIKFYVPKKWKEGPVEKIKEFFVEEYNKKHPDNVLVLRNVRLGRKVGAPLERAKVKDCIQNYDDLYVTSKPDTNANTNASSYGYDDRGLYVPNPPSPPKNDTRRKDFDERYSRFDNIVCSSDDDEECHPNIEKMTWRRLRKKQREEKRAQQEKRLEELAELAEVARAELDSSDARAVAEAKKTIEACRKEEISIRKVMKLTLEDVCKVTDERTMVSANASVREVPTATKKEDEAEALESFIKNYDSELIKYIECAERSYAENKEYLQSRPHLLCEQCTGWLLLRALEAEMGGDRGRMKQIVKQYLQLQTVMDLAKSTKKDPRDFIVRFFSNLDRDPKNREKFMVEVEDFAKKIQQRAADKKREEAEKRKLAEELGLDTEDGKYEYQELTKEERMGPGGLDPVEVFKTLPKAMQEAFDKQDIPLLQTVIANMPKEEAAYHMKRCEDSGLWVANRD